MARIAVWLLAVAAAIQVIVPSVPPPHLTSLSITSGGVGNTVVLTGTGFQASQGTQGNVFFNGTLATVSAWAATSITVTVPNGATTGPVLVSQAGVSSNTLTFTIAAAGSAQTCTGGTTYYVRTDGNNANTGTANTSGGAWLTITKGIQTAVAGDCVRVQAGTYVETASTTHNGTSGNSLTVVADGVVTTCGMSFSGNSYIRIIGLTMNPNASTCGGSPAIICHLSGSNTGLEFWNLNVGNISNGNNAFGTTSVPDRCTKCLILGGSFHDITNAATAIAMVGDDNYIGYVTETNICYIGINPSGSRLRFINDNFSGFIQCAGTHPDFYFINTESPGYATSVVESNFGIGTPNAGDNKYFHAANPTSGLPWTNDVWRYDVSYNMGSAFFSMYALSGGSTLTNWSFYHNTNTYGEQDSTNTTAIHCGDMQNQGGGALTYVIFNTIFYQCWGNSGTSGVVPWQDTNPVARNFNLLFSPLNTVTVAADWTAQANKQTNVDPLFNSFATQDYTLQSGSPARNAGGNLTTAVSCSGAVLTVAAGTGNYFIADNSSNLPAYGGKFVPGDTILLDGTTYVVSSIATDALTVTPTPVCSNGDLVYIGTTSTVDLGAYPYKAGGYTLSATKSCSGGTCTVTPNDATLVRYVICYEGSVPYAVVNASPYTCNNPSGTFEARVYPRYPSQTLWAVAQ